MDTAVWVALITSGASLLIAGASLWSQRKSAHEEREEERRSQAKVVLDRYRGPLLAAAWELGDRIDNIQHRGFLAFSQKGDARELDAKLTTLFRFAQYFGWREVLRTEVQLLTFEKETDTRVVSGLLDDIVKALASDSLDQDWAMLWSEEQRGIGELIVGNGGSGPSFCSGYAAFKREYDAKFSSWMDGLARDLLSPYAVDSSRLRILRWALYGLVHQLDEERTYTDSAWMARVVDEVGRRPQANSSRVEERVRTHLVELLEVRGDVYSP